MIPPEGIYNDRSKFQNGYPTKDWLTKANAEALAGSIQRYWERNRMPIPKVRVEMVPCLSKSLFIIRSDMINGFPRSV